MICLFSGIGACCEHMRLFSGIGACLFSVIRLFSGIGACCDAFVLWYRSMLARKMGRRGKVAHGLPEWGKDLPQDVRKQMCSSNM